jgi:SAM-dependent methyltransferase
MLAGFHVFDEISPRIFANTGMSALLAKSHTDTLHALSLFYGEEIHRSWDALLPSVQTGTPAFQLTFQQPVFSYFKEHPKQAALFQAAMKEKSQAVIQSALASYDFTPFRSVYDIGGGYGQFMQALLRHYPHLSGVLFELPEVVAAIQQKAPSLGARCALAAGDFFLSVPQGGDVYLLKSVLHDWDDAQCGQILANCHRAMSSDSRLLIIEVVLQPKSLSVYANCMDVLMLAITGGKERSLAAFQHLLEQGGFVLERIYPTATEFSILEARKAS